MNIQFASHLIDVFSSAGDPSLGFGGNLKLRTACQGQFIWLWALCNSPREIEAFVNHVITKGKNFSLSLCSWIDSLLA